MDREIFKERVAQAIRDEIPQEANRKSWFGSRSVDFDIGEDILRLYAKGEHACPGNVLLAMFDLWGSKFEAKVRGATTPPLDSAKATEHLKAALEALGVRDDATVIAADFAQRTGLK